MNYLIGLGNFGERYDGTRHNVGFVIIDKLATELGLEFSYNKYFDADICNNSQILLAKPRTLMNRSGQALSALMQKNNISLDDVIVVHDDTEIALGEVRIKKGGSSAGHNGIKSIDEMIGNEYWRVRVGVGRPENQSIELADYVLANFGLKEQGTVDRVVDQAADYLLKCLVEPISSGTIYAKEN